MKILLFAGLREIAGGGEFSVDLPPDSLARDAIAALEKSIGVSISQMGFMTAVNQHYVLRTEKLADGDELALIPPVSGGSIASSDVPAETHIEITGDAINPDVVATRVMSSKYGAVLTFCGTVRAVNGGVEVSYIHYEAFEEMAAKVLRWIVKRARLELDLGNVAITHRIGDVQPGEVSITVAVATEHRQTALDGIKYIMDEVKTILPIWKKEYLADGTARWGGAG